MRTDGGRYPPSLGHGAENGAADFVPMVEDGVSEQVRSELRGALSCPEDVPLLWLRPIAAPLCWTLLGAVGARSGGEIHPSGQMGTV